MAPIVDPAIAAAALGAQFDHLDHQDDFIHARRLIESPVYSFQEVTMLSQALRYIRVFHNVSAEHLGESLGYSKSYISEIETGKKRINIDVIERYAKFFDLPVSQIFLLAEGLEDGKVQNRKKRTAQRVIKRIVNWITDEAQS